MSSVSCKITRPISVNPLATHCPDLSKQSSNLPPRLSFGHGSQTLRVKEEDLGSRVPHNTVHSDIHEIGSTNDIPHLGPPAKPSIHSNIAARSKDALLRHQVLLYDCCSIMKQAPPRAPLPSPLTLSPNPFKFPASFYYSFDSILFYFITTVGILAVHVFETLHLL